MARLYQTGLELNSTTSGVEAAAYNGTTSIVTSNILSGTYAIRCNPSANLSHMALEIYSSNTQAVTYFRAYVYIVTAPSAQTQILHIGGTSGSLHLVSIRCNTDRTLQLYNEEDSSTIGSASSALSLNTWYLVELSLDTTTLSSSAVEGKINCVSFASGTANLANGQSRCRVGNPNTSTTYNIYFDNIAINDNSGSFQNSYPGQGKIIHLRPNAAGDNAAWTGSYTDIDEVTPDDTTTKLSSNTLDQITDVNIDSPSALGDQDTINVVAVGVRYNGVGASANASFVLRIKASASGTVEESSAITPSNTTWVTNANAVPRNYPLVLYDLPGASTTPWKKNDLEQAQIGVRLSSTSTNAAQVSTLWASIDYIPVTVKKWGIKPK